MNSNTRIKGILAAVALAGAFGVAGGAFTAGGVSDTSSDGFVGGTVSQTITGAEITNVAYAVSATNEIDSVTLTFAAGANGKAVAIDFDDALSAYTCGTVATNSSTCTATTKIASADAGSLVITVSL